MNHKEEYKVSYLSGYIKSVKSITMKEKEIQGLRDCVDVLPSPQPWEGKNETRQEEAGFAKMIDCIVEKEEELEEERRKLEQLRYRILQMIETVRVDEYRVILIRRYLAGECWRAIAAGLHVSEKTAMRWHKKALQMLVLPEEEKAG